MVILLFWIQNISAATTEDKDLSSSSEPLIQRCFKHMNVLFHTSRKFDFNKIIRNLPLYGFHGKSYFGTPVLFSLKEKKDVSTFFLYPEKIISKHVT